MFGSLSDRLSSVFAGLTSRGVLRENDVDEALREVRHALLEADVSLSVTKTFIGKVRSKSIGSGVLKSVAPGQQVIKIVHDELVSLLGEEGGEVDLEAKSPIAIMLVGLQGSGKTTTAAKLALRLCKMNGCKALMASLDVHRPAAQEQLRLLGEQIDIDTLQIVAGQTPVQIASRAMQSAKLKGVDVVILDTAGRSSIDEPLMAEMVEIKAIVDPHEILLVADALTGQDAVNVASNFDKRVELTGIILTRLDGDGRGGAALSMRAVTGKPIRYVGVGESSDALDVFHPKRIAGSILGMGDIVGLVEKAARDVDSQKSLELAKKAAKGTFDLAAFAVQLEQITKFGGMGAMLGMLPGMGKMKKQLASAAMNDKTVKRQIAIISSMTPAERRKPDLLKASRKKRIAAGSGVKVEEVNRLLKIYQQMYGVMKAVGKAKQGGKSANLAGLLGSPFSRFSPGGLGPGLPNLSDLKDVARTFPEGFGSKK